MPTNDGKRLYASLLLGAALAVALVAALAAWATQLGGGNWLPVLAPFALVLAVPVAALAWLRTTEHSDGLPQAPSGPDHEPVSLFDREPGRQTTRRVA